MKSKFAKFAVSAVMLATLTACGGGGSGGSAGNANTANVDLVGAKGILRNADVVVYKRGTDGLFSQRIATGKTNEDGRAVVAVAPTDEILRLEVIVNDSTTMLDETQPLVDGEFPEVNTQTSNLLKVGQTFNTFVNGAAADGTVTASANPFTDIIYRMVKDKPNVTPAALNTYMALGKSLAGGIDPFTTQASPFKKMAADDNAQLTLLMSLNGFAASAKSCNQDNLVECQANEILKLVEELAVVNADGSLTIDTSKQVEIADKIAAILNQGFNELTAATGLTFIKVKRDDVMNAIDEAKNPGQDTSKDDFVAFFESLRDAFLDTEKTIVDTVKDLDARYKQVTLDSTIDTLKIINDFAKNCEIDGNYDIVSYGDGWSPVPDTDKAAIYDGLTFTIDSSKQTSTGNVEIAITGTKVNQNVDVNLTLTVKGSDLGNYGWRLNKDGSELLLNGTYAINNLTNATDNVTVTFKQVEAVSSKIEDKLHKVEMKGEIDYNFAQGDTANGQFTATAQLKEDAKSPDEEHVALNNFNVKIAATSGSAAATSAVLNFSGAITPADFSGNGFDAFNFKVDYNLKDAMDASLSLTRNTKDALAAEVSVLSLKVNATANTATTNGYCFTADAQQFCAENINVKSTDSRYTATVNYDSKKGDIFYAGKKVGEITRSGVQVDGTEYSFY